MTTYIVIDVECDGRIPGINSMLGFGAIAINTNGETLGEFEVNILPLKNCVSDINTMNWFENSAPEALKYLSKNQISADKAIKEFGNWLLSLPTPRIMAAHPAPFDYMWIHWYFRKFLNDELVSHINLSPFFDEKGGPALDIMTYASAVLKKEYIDTTRENYGKIIHDNSKHSHLAIEDAREYSKLLIKLLTQNNL